MKTALTTTFSSRDLNKKIKRRQWAIVKIWIFCYIFNSDSFNAIESLAHSVYLYNAVNNIWLKPSSHIVTRVKFKIVQFFAATIVFHIKKKLKYFFLNL